MARRAHRIRAMRLEPFADRSRRRVAAAFFERRHVGRRWWRRRAEEIRRESTCRGTPATCGSATEVSVRMLPCPSRPRRFGSVSATRAETRAVHVRNPIVSREPFVEERVVGVEQIERAAVLRARCCRRTAPFHAAHDLPQIVVEAREDRRRSGATFSRLRSGATDRRKFVVSASARGSASMRRTCCSRTPGRSQAALRRQVEQLIVGNAAPQEERQPRRQLEIADRPGEPRRQRPTRDPFPNGRGMTGSRESSAAPRGCRRRTCRPSALPGRRPESAGGRPRSPAAGTRAAQRSTGSASRNAIVGRLACAGGPGGADCTRRCAGGWLCRSRPSCLYGPVMVTRVSLGGSEPTCRSCEPRTDGS